MQLSEETKSPTNRDLVQQVLVTLSDGTKLVCQKVASKFVLVPQHWPVEVKQAVDAFRATLSPHTASRQLDVVLNCCLTGARVAFNIGDGLGGGHFRFSARIAAIEAIELAA